MTTPTRTEIQTPDLWQFPMDYPMKIIGREVPKEELVNEVTLILAEIFPSFDAASIEVQPSRTGKFHSLRVKLHLTSADEVNRLYTALDAAKSVYTVI